MATDRPQTGKIYRLTGGPSEPSIARGDGWKASEISDPTPEELAEAKARREAAAKALLDAAKGFRRRMAS